MVDFRVLFMLIIIYRWKIGLLCWAFVLIIKKILNDPFMLFIRRKRNGTVAYVTYAYIIHQIFENRNQQRTVNVCGALYGIWSRYGTLFRPNVYIYTTTYTIIMYAHTHIHIYMILLAHWTHISSKRSVDVSSDIYSHTDIACVNEHTDKRTLRKI